MDETARDFLYVCLGGVLSIAFWWIWNHRIIPDIRFSDGIARRRSKIYKSGYAYRIKIKNYGRRQAIDLTINVRVAIFELSSSRMWHWLDLTCSASHLPVLGYRRNRIIVLRPHETLEFEREVFPDEIRCKYRDGTLSVDDILSLGKKAYIQVYIFAYDEFSGARKLFMSRCYTVADVRHGKFKRLDIVPFDKGEDQPPQDEEPESAGVLLSDR